jgi:hypothetical protein
MVVTQIGSSGYEVMETASNNERGENYKMKDGSRINCESLSIRHGGYCSMSNTEGLPRLCADATIFGAEVETSDICDRTTLFT